VVFLLQKGDKFALPGMIMGIEALAAIAMYLVLQILISFLSFIPSIEDLEILVIALLPFVYTASISGIITGVILSSIGWKINRSKMGTLGLIFSAGALVLLLILTFVII
jgi:hypothetical protein